MKILLALALLLPCAIFAQTVGDSSEKVLKLLGNPSLSRASGEKETWIYTNGTRITFKNGVVTKVSEVSQPTVIVTEPRRDATNAPASRSPATPVSATNPAYNAGAKHGSNTGTIILGAAVLIAGVCNLLIIIAAFSDGAGWGVAVIFVPFVNLIYILTHWKKVKLPALVLLFGAIPLVFLGVYLGFR